MVQTEGNRIADFYWSKSVLVLEKYGQQYELAQSVNSAGTFCAHDITDAT